MRTDFRGLANQRQVDMFDEAVPFCDALRRIFQETGGGDAAPLRVGWREVAAYVSLRQRAEQGVDQGMDEIGRASGRERVCQYVWISVVAGSLKKNNK